MKSFRTSAVSALALLCAAPGCVLAQGFEGKIEQRQIVVSGHGLAKLLYGAEQMADDAEPSPDEVFSIPLDRILALASEFGDEAAEVQELTYYVTADKMRVEAAAQTVPGYMIMDFTSGAFRLVIPSQRMYLEITRDDMAELRERYPEAGESDDLATAPEIRALGVTREINGMSCAGYETARGEEISHIWVAAELKDVVAAFTGLSERIEAMGMADEEDDKLEMFELVGEHGFPVLEQTLNKTSWDTRYEISEVVSVQRSTPAAELFTIPGDYRRRSFMDMIGGTGGG